MNILKLSLMTLVLMLLSSYTYANNHSHEIYSKYQLNVSVGETKSTTVTVNNEVLTLVDGLTEESIAILADYCINLFGDDATIYATAYTKEGKIITVCDIHGQYGLFIHIWHEA